MAKTITFTYKDTDYTLEYTRSTIRKMEDDKVDFETMDTHTFTAVFDLFRYSFWRHHKREFKNEDLIAEILALFPDKEKLYETLNDMIGDTVAYLSDPDESEKNVIQWNIN